MSEALRLTGVGRTYNKGLPNEVRVLSGVDLAVAPGEIVAMVAPSGAGKSTLLHIAGLLDQPDSGRVEIGGRDAGASSDRVRTAIRRNEVGFVYQFHHLMQEFSALENVMLPMFAAGVRRAEAAERASALLGSVGLSGRLDHRPAEMSGGEQQRVAVCRGLANRPRLLLADEPTGNLDPATSGAVFDMLIGLVREQGLAALVATHNLDLADRMDRVVRLSEGRIAAD